MRQFMCVLVSAAMVLSGYAWGDTPVATAADAKMNRTKKCLFPKSKKRAPAWVCHAQTGGLAVAAVGAAAKSKAGLAFMEQMAAADARAQLVQKLRVPMHKKMPGSAGTANGETAERDKAFITRISEESLSGTKIMKRAYSPNGTLYVLMVLDETDAQKLRETIKAHDFGQQRGEP